MMNITSPWLTGPAVQLVCRVLADAGHQVYFVGGCVRNELLGEEISDIDLATDAHPETVMQLAREAGLKPVPTGIEHGTVTIVSSGTVCEVTTFRHDTETDGRRATVTYADTIEEDARRRDFTMNALYATPAGEVVDPLGGLSDLRARRVRFIENAEERIHEDYLRILRFFRFHAWYGDADAGLDPEGLAAAEANSAGLDTLSRERVGQETMKLLAAPDPAPALAAMAKIGVLARILPGANATSIPALIHLEEKVGVAPEPVRRLACLGADADLKDCLRLSRKHARRAAILSAAVSGSENAAELAYRHGSELGRDIMLLRSALLALPLPEGLDASLRCGEKAKFPVSAADLSGRYSGPALGQQLRKLEARWIGSGFSLTREELLK